MPQPRLRAPNLPHPRAKILGGLCGCSTNNPAAGGWGKAQRCPSYWAFAFGSDSATRRGRHFVKLLKPARSSDRVGFFLEEFAPNCP